MMNSLIRSSASLTMFVWLLAAPFAQAEVFDDGDLYVAAEQRSVSRLVLNWRTVKTATGGEFLASIEGKPLTPKRSLSYPQAGERTAILFLVDTSDPRRKAIVGHVIDHVRQIADQAKSYHLLALARFDSDFKVLAPFDSSRAYLWSKTGELNATGRTTELFRSTLKAVRMLQKVPAQRRALYIFSDGLAEDRAYFHRDVISAARKAGVVIVGIGYPRTVGESVALQTIRRLSEDTGGQFVVADLSDQWRLPDAFLSDPFQSIDNGGTLVFDLKSVIDAGLSGDQVLALARRTAAGLQVLRIPVRLPVTAAGIRRQPGVQSSIIQSAPGTTAVPVGSSLPQTQAVSSKQRWRWLLLAVGIVLALTVLVLMVLRRRGTDEAGVQSTDYEPTPYAWLELLNGEAAGTRFPIRSSSTRIGRYRDNDLAISDPAVSRYHAEIQHTRDGSFVINDLGSKNGILVNADEVNESELVSHDIIEIGDARLRFIITGERMPDEEDTAMFRTQTLHRAAG